MWAALAKAALSAGAGRGAGAATTDSQAAGYQGAPGDPAPTQGRPGVAAGLAQTFGLKNPYLLTTLGG